MTAAPRRPAMPPRLRLYVGAVVAVALLSLPLSTLAGGVSGGAVAGVEAVLLATMIGIAQRHPIQFGVKRKLSVETAPAIVAVLLFAGPLAVLTLVLGAVAGDLRTRTPLIQRLFVTATFALRAVVGVLIRALIEQRGSGQLSQFAADFGAAAGIYLITRVLVTGIAAVQLRENPLRRSWAERDSVLMEVSLSLTGIMAAQATIHAAWVLPLLVAPAAIAYRALRDSVALQAQTRLALEDLADIVDMRDHYTFEHSRRVAELARATARQLGLSAQVVDDVTMAGRVHDVGKIGIKSSVLMKPGKLTDQEWQEMRSHPTVGARLIANFPQFARGRELVLHHHERFDGKGYPSGLEGTAIPLGARVLAVADAWDAMTSHRAYRSALSVEQVQAEIELGRGRQFDPTIVDAFLQVLQARPELAVFHTAERQDVDHLSPQPPASLAAPQPVSPQPVSA